MDIDWEMMAFAFGIFWLVNLATWVFMRVWNREK